MEVRPLPFAAPSVDFILPTSVGVILPRGHLRFDQAEANQTSSANASRAILVGGGGFISNASVKQGVQGGNKKG